jgi:hypothetical protein
MYCLSIACTSSVCAQIIISGLAWEKLMPKSIDAFFYVKGGDSDSLAFARHAHADFVAFYGLSGFDVPLLQLDPQRWDGPFQQLENDNLIQS